METRRPTAEDRNQVWTYDLLFDRSERGQTLKLLTVRDEDTRECPAMRAGQRRESGALLATLAPLCRQHGAPGSLRTDNSSAAGGTED